MVELRPYQTEARYQLNALLNGTRHPVFVSPTGTGKTWTAIKVIEDRVSLGRRVYVLTPQEEIFDQWMRDLSNSGLNPGYINQEGVRGRGRMVYVCMPLSLVNNLPLIPKAIFPDEIFTDECHHSAAASWERIYRYFDRATRLGLTATPRRTDGKGLDHLYTDIVQTIEPAEAIEAGFLAKPMIIVPEEYHVNVPIVGDDYDPAEQARILGTTRIIGDVIEQYAQTFAGKPVLVACSTFDHAAQITEAFRAAGWQWEHLHSNLARNDRRSILKRVRSGRLSGVCTVGIGIEGMDIPGLYGLIWMRRTLSLTVYLQFIGRVLRPLPGKDRGVIVDPVGNLYIHGWPEAHRNWTLAPRDETKSGDADLTDDLALELKRCPVCGVMNSSGNVFCHLCGESFAEHRGESGRKIPAMIDGVMVAVEADVGVVELRNRAQEVKAELAEREHKEEQARGALVEIDTKTKGEVLRANLFATGSRRELFNDAVRQWL